jgi:uncharacterized lipoprotein YmbA
VALPALLKYSPTHARVSLRWLAAVVAVALLAGCLGGGRSAPPAYYLLTARTPQGSEAASFAIGVGPVTVAPFLARNDIVVHGGGSAMRVSEGERWGEPLENGVQRVLLQNLHALTGAQTRNFPWRQSALPRFAVRVDVIDLDRLDDGSALLEVNWLLEDLQQSKVLQTRQQRLTVAAGGSGTGALTAAYSELLAQLAQQIAASLPPAP